MKQKNQKGDKTAKRPVSRPVERQMPEPISDTPENIARILMTTKTA